MNSAKKKRGLFASRAHSFKENILDAIKHGQVPTPHRKSRPEKNAIVLAKKTSSSDNLTVTGHLGTAKTTDCLIKDVQFALKYFQDVVSKQTYEMLPGCATVVLETVLAIKVRERLTIIYIILFIQMFSHSNLFNSIQQLYYLQAFADNIEDAPMDTELSTALHNAFKSVSVLTAWADSVIIEGGNVDTGDETDFIDTIIEPVRRAVIIAVNCISVRVGHKSLSRGNSLPDITSDNTFDQSVDLSHSSESISNIGKPPLLPKHNEAEAAPPLPPKHLKPKLDRFEDLLAHSLSMHSMDWVSHNEAAYPAFPTFEPNQPRQSLIRRTQFINSHHDKSLPSPVGGLNTTFNNDQSFEYSFENASQKSLSRESLTNMSLDEPDCPSSQKISSLNLASISWSSRERSNTSSPSIETLSFNSHLSDHHDRPDQPPAIPKKSRNISSHKKLAGVSSSPGVASVPGQGRVTPSRKLSQYDNVADAESYNLSRHMYELRMKNETKPVPHLQLSKSDSFSPHHPTSTTKTPAGPTAVKTSLSKTTFNRMTDDMIDVPPPLPPKKRNIMSYMEMFGKSIFPSTSDDLFDNFVQSHDLLHNVWQHNFHEYSEYAPSGLNLNFPFIQHDENNDRLTRPHHPYMNLKPSSSNGLAPALPPKRTNFSRSRPGSFRSSGSYESERRIPIVIEDNVSRSSGMSDSSTSSSSETPRMAEITKLPRLTVQIPIQRINNSNNEAASDSCILDQIDVKEHLVYEEQTSNNNNNNNASTQGKNSTVSNSSGTSELRAGTIDALVVLATQTIKNDFLYQEAFLATYRTFIDTDLLVQKLVYRFSKFVEKSHQELKLGSFLRISRNAFSLLVRVVDGLADVDFSNKPLLERLTSFITSLVETGELGLARALRSQFILKYEEHRARLLPDFDLTSLNSTNKTPSLLNFKSLEIAEQMTLLGKTINIHVAKLMLLPYLIFI